LETAFGVGCSVSGEGGSSQRDDEFKSALVVINLFALEGWHIAEALGIPCAVVSPTVVPYTPPSSFAKRFRRAYPGLYQSLLDGDDGAPASWREVEHWLWPVFTERWGQWRSERLCLNEVPFLTNGVTAQQRPTKLIYGCSPSIIQVPGYWPDTVQVCGFWFAPDDWEVDVRVPPRLTRDFFDDSGGGGVVAITLSTIFDMGLLGGADEAKHVIDVLKRALKTAGLKGIFVMSKDSCLESAWKSLYPHRAEGTTDKKRKLDDGCGGDDDESWVGGDESVQGYVGSIPFQQLFPMCVGVVHHGGSGTTASALRAGIPQIICPCVFDQFSWAERMSWLGVSPAPLKSSDFFSGDGSIERKLSTAFDFLSRPEARESAQNLQNSVLGEREDAVDAAVDTLESAVGNRILRPECSSNTNDGKMLELPNGWHVACTAKAEALFLFNEMDAYFRHVSPVPDGVIIDVGANIGMFLLATNEWLRRNTGGGLSPRARTYMAIEPMERNAACFKQNIVLHEASAGVELHRCGLTDEVRARKGSMDFTFYPNMPGNSTAYPDEKLALQKNSMKPEFFAGSEVVSCRVSTLTALLDEFHPDISKIDLVKIDAEGAELEVLQGISDKRWTIIRQVVVEVHDVNDRVRTVEELLRSKKFLVTAEPHEPGSNAWLVWGSR
jgi:FkbM family methyltransferase